MKKITLLISALAILTSGAFSQKRVQQAINANNQRCHSNEMMSALRDLDPATFDANQILREQQIQNWIANNYDANAKKAVITIPVVVQIWESTGTVPDIRVTQQIARLNADFGRTNTDAGNTPGVFSAVDTEIQFCLANVDPQGNATNGIIRRTAGGSPPQSGGADMWDPALYLNLYVYTIGGGTLGFAYPNGMQAVHITDGAFGNTSGAFNLGRTATHEVGHHFNLSHVWGDANCGDDQVADTPTQQTANYNCPTHPSASCSNSGDMFMNYMDYVNDNCMNAFTAGQKARMIASLNTVRIALSTSSTTNCAALPIDAIFSANVTTINAGQTVTFTESSTGPNTITSWNWNFDVTGLGGVSPSTMGTQGAHVVTYNTAGTYSVSLQVGDGSNNDTETKTGYILVNPTGTVTCDSTAANWDWNTENFGPSFWGLDLNAAPFLNDGYIMGNNAYDDNGWASKVSFSGTGKELTDVLYVFVQSSGSGAATLKIWDADGTGKDLSDATVLTAPGTVMASASITTGQFSANLNQFIAMPISPAVALNGDFYIGYDHPAAPGAGDTLAMGTATGTTGNQIWANEAGIGFRDVEYWGSGAGGNGTALNYKGTVVAVICDISTGEKEILGNLANIMVYPNPSIGTINIALTDKVSSTVSVYNMLGEEIFNSTKNTQLFTVDMNNQPNGAYFVKIKSGDNITTKKVILSK